MEKLFNLLLVLVAFFCCFVIAPFVLLGYCICNIIGGCIGSWKNNATD